MMPPILHLFLHSEKAASVRMEQGDPAFQVRMQKTGLVLLKLQAFSNECRGAGSRTGSKVQLCARAADCMVQWSHAIALPRLFVKPRESHKNTKEDERRRYYTSQIQTSNTGAAASYAVSPQLFRTRGFAPCLVSKYSTTGRWPLEAAFTMNNVVKRRTNQNGKEPTKRGPAPFTTKVDTTHTIYFVRGTSAFAEPSDDVKVSLLNGSRFNVGQTKATVDLPLSKHCEARSTRLHHGREHLP
jgi:hypothetical protein